jgi:hypothetical protein
MVNGGWEAGTLTDFVQVDAEKFVNHIRKILGIEGWKAEKLRVASATRVAEVADGGWKPPRLICAHFF